MEKTAAFDSALFKLELPGQSIYKMMIGSGIVVKNPEEFKTAYDAALASLFDALDIQRERKAYCASELSAIFEQNGIKEEKFLSDFFKMLYVHFEEIHFYYTFLPGMDSVSVFGAGPGPYEKIPVISKTKGKTDFFDVIEPSYAMLCAWKYSLSNPTDVILIDNFQGYCSPAWEELWKVRSVYVYYDGDGCNSLISCADLMVRLLKLRLLKTRIRFTEEHMGSLVPELKDKFMLDFLGKRYLHKIAPYTRKRIKNSQMLKHPIYYIIRERSKDEDEASMIKATPMFSRVLNHAFETNGSVKFFHPDDTRIMADGDAVLTIGERGEKLLSEMKKLGVAIRSLNQILDV